MIGCLQAYKKVCPRGKVCAIQTLEWPKAMKFPVCVHKNVVQGNQQDHDRVVFTCNTLSLFLSLSPPPLSFLSFFLFSLSFFQANNNRTRRQNDYSILGGNRLTTQSYMILTKLPSDALVSVHLVVLHPKWGGDQILTQISTHA